MTAVLVVKDSGLVGRGPTRGEDALFWDRPRVVNHRVFKYTRTTTVLLSPPGTIEEIGVRERGGEDKGAFSTVWYLNSKTFDDGP